MDLADKMTELMDQFLGANTYLLEEAASADSITVRDVELRTAFITQLTSALAALNQVVQRLNTSLDKTKAIHANELAALDSLMNKMKRRAHDTAPSPTKSPANRKPDVMQGRGNTAARPRTPSQKAWTTVVTKSSSRKKPAPAQSPRCTDIKFTDSLMLSAIDVPTFDYVQQDGALYYVHSADHFAIKLAGCMLHGNIGKIYTEEKNPSKIKGCRFENACAKHSACDYYHDPLQFHGSKDHRNFIASSWLYAPPNSHYKNRVGSRRFGSREHLDIDIVGLNDEEIGRFYDQTMHDLLCALLLYQTRARGESI